MTRRTSGPGPAKPGLPRTRVNRVRRERAPKSDHDLGIHTARPSSLQSFAIRGDHAVDASRYEPTPYGVLDDMFVSLGLDYPRFTFVDLGSGKGRILCLAATYPFAHVFGVEHALELHELAQQNIRALGAARRRCRDVRSLHSDAAKYRFPPDPTVIFMFNPFAAGVMARVIENLERSLDEHPREVWILYYMPVLETILERSKYLRPVLVEYDRVIYRSDVAD